METDTLQTESHRAIISSCHSKSRQTEWIRLHRRNGHWPWSYYWTCWWPSWVFLLLDAVMLLVGGIITDCSSSAWSQMKRDRNTHTALLLFKPVQTNSNWLASRCGLCRSSAYANETVVSSGSSSRCGQMSRNTHICSSDLQHQSQKSSTQMIKLTL